MYVPKGDRGDAAMRGRHLSIPPEHPEASKRGTEPDHNESSRPNIAKDIMRSCLNEVRQQIVADKTYEETKQDNQPSSDPHRSGWIPIHAKKVARNDVGGEICTPP
jgi:hypothetical protein